jgi:hypothetical protein
VTDQEVNDYILKTISNYLGGLQRGREGALCSCIPYAIPFYRENYHSPPNNPAGRRCASLCLIITINLGQNEHLMYGNKSLERPNGGSKQTLLSAADSSYGDRERKLEHH